METKLTIGKTLLEAGRRAADGNGRHAEHSETQAGRVPQLRRTQRPRCPVLRGVRHSPVRECLPLLRRAEDIFTSFISRGISNDNLCVTEEDIRGYVPPILTAKEILAQMDEFIGAKKVKAAIRETTGVSTLSSSRRGASHQSCLHGCTVAIACCWLTSNSASKSSKHHTS